MFPDLLRPSPVLSARVHEALGARRGLFLEAVDPCLAEVRRDEPHMAVELVQAAVTGACVHRASQGAGVLDGLSWSQFADQLGEMAVSYLLAGSPLAPG